MKLQTGIAMSLTFAAVLLTASQCAPTVAPETLLALVQVESRFDPLAIGINGSAPATLLPSTPSDAVAKARAFIAAGRNIDLGLAQINSRNLSRLGLTVEDAFDPCANLAAAARVLAEGYERSQPAVVGPQLALRRALSVYNTGGFAHGFSNGYVQKVSSAAARLVPALHADGSRPAVAPSTLAPLPRPPWDVFREVPVRPASFVVTFSSSVAGGRP